MSTLYNYLSIPFGWVLSLFYSVFDNYLLSLICLVVIVRLILLPTTIKQQKNSAKQLRLQARVNKIRAKYAPNGTQPTKEAQQRIQQETQELYSKEGFNPSTSGCLPMIFQFIIMIGLYGVVYAPLTKVLQISDTIVETLAELMDIATTSTSGSISRYEIELLQALGDLDVSSLISKLTEAGADATSATTWASEILSLKDQFMIGSIDLTSSPDYKSFSVLWVIPILAFATSMASSILMYIRQRKTNPDMAKNPSMGCMTFMSPVMSLIFAFMFPALVGLYWVLSNIFTFFQTLILNFVYSPEKQIAQSMIDETVQRRSKERNTKALIAMAEQNQEAGKEK